MTGLTAQLAAFTANPRLADLPPRAVEIVQSGFADTIATMLAGREEPVVRIARDFVAGRQSAAAEASLLLGERKAAAADAALVNGAAGHALDFDDVALGGHPSTVLVPAVLAEGERLDASGEDALRAYLVGYEVWAELFRREPDAYHLKGWHPTAVLGTVGAAAAVASLNKLPQQQCQHAIALAASMACGLVANFGTMTKPLHAGRAAAAAIDAVRFAASGLTAAPDAIEHHAGYLAALSPQGRVDRESPAAGLGRELRVLEYGLSIKKYPTCYATHRVIDGVLDLAREHRLRPEDVQEVRTRIGVAQASMLRNHQPVTGLEAKFSLEFAVASALVAGKVGLGELTDDFVGQRAVREVFPKVRIATDDTPCPIEPIFARNDSVQIVLRDGRTLETGDIRFARGNAMAPLAPADLRTKFIDCAGRAPDIDAAALFARLMDLRSVPRLRALAR
ncbi:MmgE/PrpD family protein [Ramlibacter sp.]|uniref:MmgE/PrpD family protein n=1 Tax=Ramlibacter sp. TaxID=1917967 RepID=UPI002CAE816D|nr:MmgE/PrpD family protein [Ramlibacter sp.]HWI82134.1 MmgE/PrpD family protein [Ramlibacter sp.]